MQALADCRIRNNVLVVVDYLLRMIYDTKDNATHHFHILNLEPSDFLAKNKFIMIIHNIVFKPSKIFRISL